MSAIHLGWLGSILALSLGLGACEEGAAPLTADARPADPIADANLCELDLPDGAVARGYEGMVSPDGQGCGVGFCASGDGDCRFSFVGGACAPSSIAARVLGVAAFAARG